MAIVYLKRATNSDLTGAGLTNVDHSKDLIGGAAGSDTEFQVSVASGGSEFRTLAFYTEAGEPASGGSGSQSFGATEVRVITGNTSGQISVRRHRVNSGGTIQASGAFTAEQQASAGVKTFAAQSIDLGTWAAGDRYLVEVRVRNSSAHGGAITVGIGTETTDDEDTAPWSTPQIVAVGQATETDLAQAMGREKTKLVKRASQALVASDYDGTNDFSARTTGLIGNDGGLRGLISFLFKLEGGDAVAQVFVGAWDAGTTRLLSYRNASNKVGVLLVSAAGTQLVSINSSTSFVADGLWHSAIVAWNHSSATQSENWAYVYVDDTQEANDNSIPGTAVGVIVDDHLVGAHFNESNKLNAQLAELFIRYGSTADPTVEANRRKFFDADGNPAYKGEDGSLPLGVVPEVYAPNGDPSDNKGDGGDYTNTGTLDAVEITDLDSYHPSETDLAQTITPQLEAGGQTVAVGQVTEADLAQAVEWAPKNRLVAQSLETDTAQALAVAKAKAIGQVAETDLAQQFGRLKTQAFVQATEADLAQVVTSHKTTAISQVTETDLAQQLGRLKTAGIVQATEADLAQAFDSLKAKGVGLVSETDTAQAITSLKAVSVVQATETDLSQTITPSVVQTIAVAQVLETDAAQAVTWSPKNRLVAQAVETDLAQVFASLKTAAVAQVTETDLAQAITALKTAGVVQVSETDLAQAIGRLKTLAIGQSFETDLAQTVSPEVGITVELGQVSETDLAQVVTWAPKARLVATAVESDVALAITPVKSAAPSAGKIFFGGPDEDDDDLLDAKHERRYPKIPQVPAVAPTPKPTHRPQVAVPIERPAPAVARRRAELPYLQESAQAIASVKEVIGQANIALQDEVTRLALEREEMELIALAVAIAMDDE